MHLAIISTFAVDRKAPLADVVGWLHAAFGAAMLEPALDLTLLDGPVTGKAVAVDRVVKTLPALAPFVRVRAEGTGRAGALVLETKGAPLTLAAVQEIAAGVPRRFAVQAFVLRYGAEGFGPAVPLPGVASALAPGLTLRDDWWVNGRQRSLTAVVVLEADPDESALPPLPAPIAALLGACGKVTGTRQIAVPDASAPPVLPQPLSPQAQAAKAIVADYRARIAEIVSAAALPHALPPPAPGVIEAAATGPKQPVLQKAFSPLGYECRSGSGCYTLSRRTASNLTVQVYIDVGTWNRSALAQLRLRGLGFAAALPLPVSAAALQIRQYRIAGPETWQQIVDNLAVLVAYLDRTLVPAVEAAAGPSPDWYRPEA